MINLYDIRYVRLGTTDLEAATDFVVNIVGLDIAHRVRGATYFKSDQRDHTLVYFEGDPADQTVGFELTRPDDLDAAAAALEQGGHAVHWGTRDECDLRATRAFVNFKDPTGNSIDLLARPYHSGLSYHGARATGITGFNHIGLCSTDTARDEAFWTTMCNARVSDWISEAALIRVRTAHHSIALFPWSAKGVQHINHQVGSVDDVLRAYYYMLDHNIPIQFGPGRHPTSGAMFLYFTGPHGMVYEYSHGVRHIQPEDEADYRPRQFAWDRWSLCHWGSKPDIPAFRLAQPMTEMPIAPYKTHAN